MVVRPRPGLFAILFTLRGSILPKVAPRVIVIALVSLVVVLAEHRWPEAFPVSAGIGPFTLVGIALSIFLSFRNGACYDRWWEGRKAWGQLIDDVRGLCRLVGALLPGPEHEALRRRSLRRLAGFAHALHARLRDGDEAAAAAPWLPADEAPVAGRASPTDAILAGFSAELARAMRSGAIADVLFASLDKKVSALSQIHAACERIKGTPLPFAYTLLLYRTAWLYCLLLPVGLAASLGFATPVVAALVAYTFFGLDALGDELEEPFGLEANDLPLDALLRAAERTVLDALGDEVPPPLPLDGTILH